MHHSITVMAVTEECLKSKTIPWGFKLYVEKYFEKTEIFGQKCRAAFRVLSLDAHKKSVGVAPIHAADCKEYCEGLPEGMRLNEWIYQNKKLFWEFSQSYDDGCIGSVVED